MPNMELVSLNPFGSVSPYAYALNQNYPSSCSLPPEICQITPRGVIIPRFRTTDVDRFKTFSVRFQGSE
jgi:hypothetical protein